MITAAPGATFTAVAENFATGLTGTIGVRVENPDGTNQTPRATAGIVEVEAGSGIYSRSGLTAPSTAGTYIVIWDDGTTFESEELFVTSTAPTTTFLAPLPAADLCTLEDVRAELQKPEGDLAADLILAATVTRASQAIMRYTEREFAPATDDATRTFELDDQWWDTFLSLAPYDLRGAPATVKIDTDISAGVSLTAQEYRLFPRPARDGVYSSIRLRPQNFGTSDWFGDLRELQITGDWGFPSVPEDVRHAATVTAADWYRRDIAAFSTSFNLETDRLDVPQSMPKGVLDILDRYRRMAL